MFWNNIKYFKPQEFSGVEKMDIDIIRHIDGIRGKIGKPIIIHEAYAYDGHCENSKHYIGKAIDFHIQDVMPIEGFYSIEEYLLEKNITRNSGLGLYLNWNNIGFHLDLFARTRKGRWGAFPKGQYLKLSSMKDIKSFYYYLALNKRFVYNKERKTYSVRERRKDEL